MTLMVSFSELLYLHLNSLGEEKQTVMIQNIVAKYISYLWNLLVWRLIKPYWWNLFKNDKWHSSFCLELTLTATFLRVKPWPFIIHILFTIYRVIVKYLITFNFSVTVGDIKNYMKQKSCICSKCTNIPNFIKIGHL